MTYQDWCQENLGLAVPDHSSCRGLCTCVSDQRALQQHLRSCLVCEGLHPCASPASPWEVSRGSTGIMSARPKSFKEEHPLGEPSRPSRCDKDGSHRANISRCPSASGTRLPWRDEGDKIVACLQRNARPRRLASAISTRTESRWVDVALLAVISLHVSCTNQACPRNWA